jgi:hypothetical protein
MQGDEIPQGSQYGNELERIRSGKKNDSTRAEQFVNPAPERNRIESDVFQYLAEENCVEAARFCEEELTLGKGISLNDGKQNPHPRRAFAHERQG